jgi:hypothetical protein
MVAHREVGKLCGGIVVHPSWRMTGKRMPKNSFNGGPIPAHEVSYNPDGKHCHTRPPQIRVVLPYMDGDRPFLFQPGHRTEVRFA